MPAQAFADPVFDAQRVFRAAMNALARPGSILDLGASVRPPEPLSPELAALALALADHETPIWLDAALAGSDEVRDFLRFHTGAPITTRPDEAAFALVGNPALCPPLASFAQGTPEYPDRSTTLFIHPVELGGDGGFTLRGPGIADTAQLGIASLPPDFANQWADNRRLFPRGVDLLFVANGRVAGLPRTTQLSGEG